jgi:hypothetical protein
VKQTLHSLVFAAAAFVVMNAPGTPAHAVVVVDPFVVYESPGQYSLYNYSTDLYAFAFAVSNPNADNYNAIASSGFQDWVGFPNLFVGTPPISVDFQDGNGSVPAFGYESFTTIGSYSTVPTDPTSLLNYLGPGSNSSSFFYSFLNEASNFEVIYTDNQGNVGFTYGATTVTPLPAALPLFAGGLGVISLVARRRKRKNAAALAAA